MLDIWFAFWAVWSIAVGVMLHRDKCYFWAAVNYAAFLFNFTVLVARLWR